MIAFSRVPELEKNANSVPPTSWHLRRGDMLAGSTQRNPLGIVYYYYCPLALSLRSSPSLLGLPDVMISCIESWPIQFAENRNAARSSLAEYTHPLSTISKGHVNLIPSTARGMDTAGPRAL